MNVNLAALSSSGSNGNLSKDVTQTLFDKKMTVQDEKNLISRSDFLEIAALKRESAICR